MCFTAIAVCFAIGDVISKKTKGIISSLVVAILIFIIFGGTFEILPADLCDVSGLTNIINAFGMSLILVNVGSTLDLNDLKAEWKTVLVALASVAGIIVLDFTLGSALFGKAAAYTSSATTAGGMVACIMVTGAANEAGQPDIATLAAAICALQMLIGLPISCICLRRAGVRFVNAGKHQLALDDGKAAKRINFRLLPQTPASLNIPNVHLARLGIVAVAATLLAKATGISSSITCLVLGILCGAIGIVDRGCLRTAGAEGLITTGTYAIVLTSFLTMKIWEFGELLIPVFGLLLLGAVGVAVAASLFGLIFKWDPWLSIGVGFACMFGYPGTYEVSVGIVEGIAKERGMNDNEKQRLTDYILPKMLISGIVSISIVSIVLAGIVIPMVL